MIRLFRLWLIVLVMAGPATAQDDDDKGFLERTIQNSLSGAGRTVTVDGFKGALSSQATMTQMTISDDQGVWLTLEGVVLDWRRTALLRGRLEVDSLTAERLVIERAPIGEKTEELPDAEAKPFALPDLPVAINIAQFKVAEIALGEALAGEPIALTVTASIQFDDDLVAVDFDATRIDGEEGAFVIKANLDRNEETLDLLVNASEQEAGIVAGLLRIPGEPAVNLRIEGSGPLSDFASDIALATNGEERLSGQVTLATQAPERSGDTPDRRVQATLGGDVTPLMEPEYHDFFGENVQVALDTVLKSDGAIDINAFVLNTQAIQLEGKILLDAEKWPEFVDVSGTIADVDQSRVVLPVPGAATSLQRAAIDVKFDEKTGDAINASIDVTGLVTDAIEIRRTQLALAGVLEGNVGGIGEFEGDVTFDAGGLTFSDAAITEALGEQIKGAANIIYIEGAPLKIAGLELGGEDYGLLGEAEISGIGQSLLTILKARLEAQDISRFSALAGRELDGAANLSVDGSIRPLDGAFDIALNGETQDIKVGIEQADAVLAGQTTLSLTALRDETGTFVRDLSLQNPAVTATGAAELRTDNSRVALDAQLADIAIVLPQYQGPITVSGSAVQDAQGWSVDASTDGPYDVALTVNGLATGENMDLDFSARVPEVKDFVADAPVGGEVTLSGNLRQTTQGLQLNTNVAAPANVRATVQGALTPVLDVRFGALVPEVEAFVPQVTGAVNASGNLRQTPSGYEIDTDVDGPYEARVAVKGALTPLIDISFDASVPELNPLVPQVNGPLNATGQLRQTEQGFFIDTSATGPYDVRAAVKGALTPMLDITFDASVPELNPLVPQVNGPLNATGQLSQTEDGIFIDTTANGPYAARAAVKGALAPMIDITFDANVPELNPLVPQVNGPLVAAGKLRQTEQGFFVDTTATGPYGARALVEGLATGPDMSMTFDVSVPDVQPLVPSISGPLQATGSVQQTADGIAVDTNASGPYSSNASVKGVVTGETPAVDFELSMPNIGAIVPNLPGPFSVTGSANQQSAGWQIETSATGPSGTQATVGGLVGNDGNLNLEILGDAPLGLSAPFIAPRSLQGLTRFDIRVDGPPALNSVSGSITTAGASFSAPNLRVVFEDIAADIQLADSAAQLNVTAQASSGGGLSVNGGINLTGSLPANIEVVLNNLALVDPRLFSTTLNGNIRFDGPATGGANIAGRIDIGETNVTVPSTGLTSIGSIPPITFVGAPADVIATRRKAGLEGADAGTDPAASGGGPSYGLNMFINAPNRIFVRGRGLDAELGGDLTLTGTTQRIISAGRFDLVRGRLDILGKRFDLDEGSIQFQGDLSPFILFQTSTSTEQGEARIIVDGPVTEPEVRFESTPEAPEDEVLAQILFGQSLNDISAFQAVQLASAVATLAGGGGGGTLSKLRENIGLDDLDVTTTDEGATAVRAGRYLTDDLYTDLTAASDGTSEISLNYDLTESGKAKVTTDNEGESSIGLFFEKDY